MVQLSTLGHMTTSPTFRVGRFLTVAFCMTVVAAGLTILWFSFPDTRPPTMFESICGYVCLVWVRSTSLVNIPAIADVVKINAAKFQIEFIKHAIVADAEFEFRTALQSFVGKTFKPRPHFINLVLDGLTKARRQVVERF